MEYLENNSDFIISNPIAKKFGIDCAILLWELGKIYDRCKDNNSLVTLMYEGNTVFDKCFSTTRDIIEQDTTLSPYKQRKALEKLKCAGIIDYISVEQLSKTYYTINESIIRRYCYGE